MLAFDMSGGMTVTPGASATLRYSCTYNQSAAPAPLSTYALESSGSAAARTLVPSTANAFCVVRDLHVANIGASSVTLTFKIGGTNVYSVTLAVGYTVEMTYSGGAWIVRSDTGATLSIDYIQFNTSFGGGTFTPGRLYWDVGNNCLTFDSDITGSSLQIGQEMWIRVYNNTGSTITDGSAVCISGASGQRPTIALAKADSVTTWKGTIGMATANITNNSEGWVTVFGLLHDVNTNSFNAGDLLYLSSTVAGGVTATKQTAPNGNVIVGTVIVKHPVNGVILCNPLVRPTLGELSDVNISGIANGQVLQWVSANNRWENSTAAVAIGAFWAGLTSATEISVTTGVTATSSRMHVVSGTAADYTITLPAAPATGTVIGFRVKDWSAANKQYTLDATGTVKIAGRTRYLVLLHTNVVLLQYDGTDWRPLVLCLDTQWVSFGTVTVVASVNPTKGTTDIDTIRWRRVGDSCEAHLAYRQSTAGTNGTGNYAFSIPFSVDSAKIPTFVTNYTNATVGVGGSEQNGVSVNPCCVCLVGTSTVSLVGSNTVGSGFQAMGNSGQNYSYHILYPVVNW